MREINLIVIHCAATTPSMDIGVREIREWHLARGWSDIGYHYVIRRSGLIEIGRKLEIAGAHAQGYNAKSIGICLAGGLNEFDFSVKQLAALETKLTRLMAQFPDVKICGHHDLNPDKECPRFNVGEWVKPLLDLDVPTS